MIPRIVWAVVCLGLIGLWVYNGQQISSRHQMQMRSAPQSQAPIKNPISLNPSGRVHHAPEYLSAQDLRDAINGDEQAKAAVRKMIAEARLGDSNLGLSYVIESVEFGWKESVGSYTTSQHHRFGGQLWRWGHSVKLQDIRDLDSVGHDQYRFSWGEPGWSFFPHLGKNTLTQNDAVSDVWHVSLINVFGLLSLCLVIGWSVGFIGRWLGVPVIRCRLFVWVCVLLLIALAGVYAINTPLTFEQTNESYSFSQGQSKSYSMKELIGMESEDAELVKLCQKMLDILPPTDQDDYLLGQGWVYGLSPQKWAQSQSDRVYWAISHNWMLLRYSRITFIDIKPDEQIPDRYHRSVWKNFVEQGILTLQWGPIEDQRTASLGVLTLASIGVLFTLIWKCTHWVARFALGRVQKRRVRRSACIYCAYPLTQAGLQARYPENNT